ncbi:MAG: helix-hairpin-helix domain-containing protein [Gemmatimonadota bacterium]|nr:helix-hairpin-helix domain-containing protein [Gemmatimonadota bacterium]MDE2953841.1 helix-hairpin-helix domain-containing protein [Gemmatimonadota bacterium]
MFTFNRNEQIILLLLCGVLIVGIVIRYLDSKNPDHIPDFEVHKNAVEAPSSEEKTEVPQVTSLTQRQSSAEVPSPKEKVPQVGELININSATAKEFERLHGIGPQIAGRIVAYREKNGAFKRVDDITKVRGIGPKTLERLRPHLTMSTP